MSFIGLPVSSYLSSLSCCLWFCALLFSHFLLCFALCLLLLFVVVCSGVCSRSFRFTLIKTSLCLLCLLAAFGSFWQNCGRNILESAKTETALSVGNHRLYGRGKGFETSDTWFAVTPALICEHEALGLFLAPGCAALGCIQLLSGSDCKEVL